MQLIGTSWRSFWYSRPNGGRLEIDLEVQVTRRGGPIAKDPGIQIVNWSAVKPLNSDSLAHLLVPRFMKDLPRVDAWGNLYQFGLYGERLAIRSPGSDGVYQNSPYKKGGFPSENGWQDIVYIEDKFIRWPIAPPVEDWLIEND